ncbi:MAG: hypothetical protein K0R57_4813 [Paenibacillaceae bacterium]|jgi:energy-coupling factor transporter ATP-binding protein EcfA2|nr:hypothetical protein [Paenibacillaceae bacterium]
MTINLLTDQQEKGRDALLQRVLATLEAVRQDRGSAYTLLFDPYFLESLVKLQNVSYPDYVSTKKQAEELVPAVEFRRALAREARAIAKEDQAIAESDIPTLQETLGEDCPEHLSGLHIPIGWWVSKEGVLKRLTDRYGNIEWIRICSWPLIVSGVFKGYQTNEMKFELMFLRRGEWHNLLLTRTEALNYKSLQNIASAKGAPIDSSNSKDVVKYISAFESINDCNYKMKYTIDKIGWLPEHKLLVTSDGIYSTGGRLTETDYVFQPSHKTIEFQIQKITDLSAAQAVIPKLLLLNQIEVTLPVIGWMFASTISTFIRRLNDSQFPLLSIWGRPGSGKSTLAELLLRVTGNNSELQRISTSYATMKQLSETNALAIVYDELKPNEMGERIINQFTEKMKLLYRQDSDSRGRPGGVDYFPYIRPMAYIGEDYLRNNQAVVERSIIIHMSRNWLEKNSKIADTMCRSVLNHDLSAVSGAFWEFIFNYLAHDDLNNDLAEATEIVKSFESLQLHFRIQWNVTVYIIGILMYKRMLVWLGCEVPFGIDEMKQSITYTLTAVTEDMESLLDRLLIAFNYDHRQFSESDILLDRENHLLFVTASKFKAYVTMNNQQKCSAAQLKSELEYSFQNGGYVGNGKEYYLQKKIKGHNGWRYVFQTLKLEKVTDIAEDAWLNEPEMPNEVSPPPERQLSNDRSGRLRTSHNKKTPS